MNEIECLIKTAHLNLKGVDINNNLSKHANIINMSKDFIKTVTKNSHFDEDQYILDIEVKEKKPLMKPNALENNGNMVERLVKSKRPRREYKVIDATIDPNLFSKDLIDNDYNDTKKLKALRVICLAIITENCSWKNTLHSFIPMNSVNYHSDDENIDIKEIIIEWEEEFNHENKKTQKRFKTQLSKNPNATYKYSENGSNQLFNSQNSDCFQIEVTPNFCSKCNASKNEVLSQKITKPTLKHMKSHSSKRNEEIKNRSKQNNLLARTNQTLSAEINEVKQKVFKVIETIANDSIDYDTDLYSFMYKKKDLDTNKNNEQKYFPSMQRMLGKKTCMFNTTEIAQEDIPSHQLENRNVNSKGIKEPKNNFHRTKERFEDQTLDPLTVVKENFSTKLRGYNKKEDFNSSPDFKRKHSWRTNHWRQLRKRIFRRENQREGNNIRKKETKSKNSLIESKSTKDLDSYFCNHCKNNEKTIEATAEIKISPNKKQHLSKQVQKCKNDDCDESKTNRPSQLKHDRANILNSLKRKLNQDELEAIKLLIKENSCAFLDLLENCSKKDNVNMPSIGTENMKLNDSPQKISVISNQGDMKITPKENLKNIKHEISSENDHHGNNSLKSKEFSGSHFNIKSKQKIHTRKNLFGKFFCKTGVSSLFGSKTNHKIKTSRETKLLENHITQENNTNIDIKKNNAKKCTDIQEEIKNIEKSLVCKSVESNIKNTGITSMENFNSELQNLNHDKIVKTRAPFALLKPKLQTKTNYFANELSFTHSKEISNMRTSRLESSFRKKSCIYCQMRMSNMNIWKKRKGLKNGHGKMNLRRCVSLENLNEFKKPDRVPLSIKY